MTGVVLCGGQSTRMGKDKGLLKHHDLTWAQSAFSKMAALHIPVFLSLNPLQMETYASGFQPQKLIADTRGLEIRGPLAGLISVHLQYPLEDLMVLACDMPLMSVSVLEKLVSQHQACPNYDVYVFADGTEPEPLCGIYTAKALSAVHALYQKGKWANHSMKFLIAQFRSFYIPIGEQEKSFFRNVNNPEALNNL